jgi:hypothetical protein
MKYKKLLAQDPSGNFNEGKGTTGWCLFDCEKIKVISTGFINAKDFKCQEDYWNAHLILISAHCLKGIGLLVEDYLLYSTKTNEQILSRMETPKVIGVIEHFAWQNEIICHKQLASEVKQRWTDQILEHEGIIERKGRYYTLPDNKIALNRHCKDAIRHATHFTFFKNEKGASK